MEVTLDTVSLQHLLRNPIRYRDGHGTCLDEAIGSGLLTLVADRSRGLIDEWMRTCGEEAVRTVLAQWEPSGGIRLVRATDPIPYRESRRLAQLNFTDTIDKLIVRIALVSSGKTIVSDDGDFWDPDTAKRGDHGGQVAVVLEGDLGLSLYLLGQLVETLTRSE